MVCHHLHFDNLTPYLTMQCLKARSLLAHAIDLFVSSVFNASSGQNCWVADGLVTTNQGKCSSPILRT